MRAVFVLVSVCFLSVAGVACASAASAGGASALSPWLTAATKHGVEPLDLYALALQESRRLSADGQLRPWPWTLRTDAEGALYFGSYEAAAAKLKALVAAGVRNIDVGLMQVNWGWHRHRVKDASELLQPARNIEIAAQILGEHLTQYNGDLRQAFARYHSGRSHFGEPYAASVLAILEQLRALGDVGRALGN